MDNHDLIETNDLKLSPLDYPKILYFDILYHLIVLEVLVMNTYYYSYLDDDDTNVSVEDEVEYYDNDDDFVLLK
jgi:hypothetical protein